MDNRWAELETAFDRSSDARKAVLGGLAGGAGGAVGTLVGAGDPSLRLAVTVAVTAVAVVCLLAAAAYADRRAGASA